MLLSYDNFAPAVQKTLGILTEKKRLSDKLVKIYHNLGINDKSFILKRDSVDKCCSFISLASDGKFYKPMFCHDRLCPVCSWRRGQALKAQMFSVVDKMVSDYDFIMITLTVPNVPFSECRAKIKQMQKAYNNFSQPKSLIGKGIKGWFRSLEVTYNEDSDTYHPHFHCLCAVSKDYWDKYYVDTNQFWEAWKRCMGNDDSILVRPDVRKVYGFSGQTVAEAVCEVTKYSVKATDFLFSKNPEKLTKEFSLILKGFQLYGFKGVFSKFRKELLDLDSYDTVQLGQNIHFIQLGDSTIYKFSWADCFESYNFLGRDIDLPSNGFVNYFRSDQSALEFAETLPL